jgi:hypothetical protein
MRASFIVALLLATFFAGSAEARTVWIVGDKADRFIARYFPHASIPGPINAAFDYRKHHRLHRGWGSCYVPAMGGRSDGQVTTCYVKF